MISLPFIQPPKTRELRRVGNDATGVLEIPIMGGLTVGESALISELLAMEQSSFVAGAKIADAIAKEENISLTEAFNLIENSIAGRELEPEADLIRLRHADRIEQVAAVYAKAGQRSLEATVTAIIQHRLNLPQWSMSDTKELPRQLFNELWQLAQEEKDAENQPITPHSEDEIKKQLPEDGNQPKPTGRKSRGTSSLDTQVSSIETPLLENSASPF